MQVTNVLVRMFDRRCSICCSLFSNLIRWGPRPECALAALPHCGSSDPRLKLIPTVPQSSSLAAGAGKKKSRTGILPHSFLDNDGAASRRHGARPPDPPCDVPGRPPRCCVWHCALPALQASLCHVGIPRPSLSLPPPHRPHQSGPDEVGRATPAGRARPWRGFSDGA